MYFDIVIYVRQKEAGNCKVRKNRGIV